MNTNPLFPSFLRGICCLLALWTFCHASYPRRACAGLGASDVVVVVNGGSFNSRTLANHFVALRGIPARNVIVLSGVPNSEQISVDQFREKILAPLLAEIDRRKLSPHIQCIAYSADFPTSINISPDFQGVQLDRVYTKRGSINGLTFLYDAVGRKEPTYVGLEQNYFARRKIDDVLSRIPESVDKPTWTSIETAIEEQKPEQAASLLAELYSQHPHQPRLAYRAAQQYAQAGDSEKSLEFLQLAINHGWSSGPYLANDEHFESLRGNIEFDLLPISLQSAVGDRIFQSPRGFDARLRWTSGGVPHSDLQISKWRSQVDLEYRPLAKRFLLSVVLGVTRGGGTSLQEAVEILQRSAASDQTHPQGSFYFCVTKDVRSRTRLLAFDHVIEQLEALGYSAQRELAAFPQDKPAMLGAQLGVANFDWEAASSQFVPGALADNLTSFGGVMTISNSQTPLTELLKAGAAGSSGTVVEPYAVQPKFPHPNMYLYYAQGASLAEAFYLSVTGPYQLLIVGDPLCQPFSNAPKLEFAKTLQQIEQDNELVLELKAEGVTYEDWLEDERPKADKTDPLLPGEITLLIDGQVARNLPADATTLDLGAVLEEAPDGYHEVTLQCRSEDPLLQRSDFLVPAWKGSLSTVELSVLPSASQPANETNETQTTPARENPGQEVRAASTSFEEPFVVSLREKAIELRLTAPEAEQLTLWHDWEALDTSQSTEESKIFLDLRRLGLGPVRLFVLAETPAGEVRSLPLWLQIEP